MKKKILFIIGMLIANFLYAQDLQVIIKEKKQGKRISLYAENTTTDTLNAFLLIHAEGFRRSASKPIIKNIPPLSSVLMTTMIEMEGAASSYTYDLYLNPRELPVKLTKEKEPNDIATIIKNRLVIFSANGCSKCNELSSFLTSRRITHRSFNINEDPVLYGQFMSLIEPQLTLKTRIRFPVIWNKDYPIFGYDSLEEIIGKLGL